MGGRYSQHLCPDGIFAYSVSQKSNRSVLKWVFALLVIPILSYILLYVLFSAFVPPETIAKLDAAQIDFWNETVKKFRNTVTWKLLPVLTLIIL